MAQGFTARETAQNAETKSRLPSKSSPPNNPQRSGSDVIQSRDNKWLKAFRAAMRGGGPEAAEPIGVEGPKLVEEGLRAGLQAEALLVSDSGESELARILDAASQTEAGISRSRILRTTDKLFASVAGTEAPQGVAALFRQPEWTFDDVLRGAALADGSRGAEPALVVVLAGVQDPGNVGTILRSAEAFGATGTIAARGTADPWSPKAVRASAGSALRLPLLRGLAAPVVIAQLRMAGVAILAAVRHEWKESPAGDADKKTKGQHVARDGAANFRGTCAIFIGSEGHGLAAEIEKAANARISVPMSEAVESLNAAVAASVLLYEAARQRRSGA